MKKPRVSIAGLMAFVFLIAIGFAALKNPSELWASALFTTTVGMLLLAVVGVGFRGGDKQLFWAGFAVFGWGYLVLVLSTGVLKPPALLSSLLIAHIHQIMYAPKSVSFAVSGPNAISITGTLTGTISGLTQLPAFIFFQIGHTLATLLVALLGTLLVGPFARREK